MSLQQSNEQQLLVRIQELEAEISSLKRQKKYGLVWENKPEDVVAQCETHVPVLSEIKSRKISDKNQSFENIIIEGDNYHALSVLNYTHRNAIDVIYIDPPYNTGARDWKYNNDYVDSEDSYRHSKWVSMMHKRLTLARNLLSEDGVLIATIDHNEQENLGLLLKEIFYSYIIDCVVIIHNPAGIQGNNFSYTHEFAYFVYPQGGRKIAQTIRDDEDSDIRNFRDVTGEDSRREAGKNCFYPILVKDEKIIGFGDVVGNDVHPSSMNILRKDGVTEVYPIDPKGVERKWRFARNTVESIKDELQVHWLDSRKVFDIKRVKNRFNFKTVWTDSKYSANNHGTQLLNRIIEPGSFSYPKSIYAVKDCLHAALNYKKSATVLDFFAGSGTTGHAVLELNKEDGGNRQFILCTNNENKIAEEVTYPRVKKVIKGYGDTDGLGGALRYYKTKLVNIEKLHKVPDTKRLQLTYQAGEMIALRENVLEEKEKTEWWQIFAHENKTVAIYFQEDKQKLRKLIEKVKSSKHVVLYVFSWSKNEYKNEFAEYQNIRVEDIPEPIIEVYKEINRLK